MGAVLPLRHRAARPQHHTDGDQIVPETKARGITPSQTVGPFFAYGMTPNGKYEWNDAFTNNLVTADTTGERIRVEGRVFDGDGQPVPDCMLEIWQADALGTFADPKDKRALPNSKFRGFGRCGTDANGDYAFDTIKPGQVPDPDGKPQAPHILLAIFARGMLLHNYTRIYLDTEAANASDPVLALVPSDRRATLIARREPGNGNPVYRFDIHLQRGCAKKSCVPKATPASFRWKRLKQWVVTIRHLNYWILAYFVLRNEMKRVALGLLLASIAGAAYAADLPAPGAPYTKAPAVVSPAINWSGFYIRAMGGYASQTGGDPNINPISVKGGFGGATVGYNWQFGTIVAGIEAD